MNWMALLRDLSVCLDVPFLDGRRVGPDAADISPVDG